MMMGRETIFVSFEPVFVGLFLSRVFTTTSGGALAALERAFWA